MYFFIYFCAKQFAHHSTASLVNDCFSFSVLIAHQPRSKTCHCSQRKATDIRWGVQSKQPDQLHRLLWWDRWHTGGWIEWGHFAENLLTVRHHTGDPGVQGQGLRIRKVGEPAPHARANANRHWCHFRACTGSLRRRRPLTPSLRCTTPKSIPKRSNARGARRAAIRTMRPRWPVKRSARPASRSTRRTASR